MLIYTYFKINASHSNFQICWGIKILQWSVNTDQNGILITSTNLKILLTNQFYLCINENFPWNFQVQVVTYEERCHISAIKCQRLIKHRSNKCRFVLSFNFKVNASPRPNKKCPHPRSVLKWASMFMVLIWGNRVSCLKAVSTNFLCSFLTQQLKWNFSLITSTIFFYMKLCYIWFLICTHFLIYLMQIKE